MKLTFTERRSAASTHSDAVRRQRRESNIGSLRGLQPANWAMARPLGRPSPEIKSFDVLVAGNTLPVVSAAAGADPATAFTGITCINEVQLGDSYYNRIGSRATVKSVSAHFQILTSTAGVYPYSSIRWMLIYDRQTNGAYPAIGDILSLNDTGVPGQGYFNASLNMVNRSRFLVLRDQYVDQDLAQKYYTTVKEFVKGRWDCEYNSPTSANIGVMKTGAIYFLAFTDAAALPSALSDATFRIRYYD